MASESDHGSNYSNYDIDSYNDYLYSDSSSESNTRELTLEPSSIVASCPKHSIRA